MKKRMSKLTKYVIFSIAIVLLYTAWDMYNTMTNTGFMEPSTLTTCVFGFFGGEVVTCALIKIFNIRSGDPQTPEPMDDIDIKFSDLDDM